MLQGRVVGGHEAVEPECVAQQVREHLARDADRDAIDVRVGVHDGLQSGEPDRGLERVREDIPGLPRAALVCGEVHAARGEAVAEKVLGCGDHPLGEVVALDPSGVGDTERRAQVRVLPVGLVHAAPPWIEGDVHHRRECLTVAQAAHLTANQITHVLDQFRAECGGETGGGREHHVPTS